MEKWVANLNTAVTDLRAASTVSAPGDDTDLGVHSSAWSLYLAPECLPAAAARFLVSPGIQPWQLSQDPGVV